MNIEFEHRGDGIIVCRPTGALDVSTARGIRQRLDTLMTSPKLVIDVSRVTFVDSSGLGALMGAIRWIRDLGGVVAVACNRPTLFGLLSTTGFDRLVTVVETVEDAVGRLDPPDPGGRPA